MDANSFILLRGSPEKFAEVSFLTSFLLRLSLKDNVKMATKKRRTAIPENLISDSIQEASSNLVATPEDASTAMKVIAIMSKTLSTVREEKLVVKARSLLFFQDIHPAKVSYSCWKDYICRLADENTPGKKSKSVMVS